MGMLLRRFRRTTPVTLPAIRMMRLALVPEFIASWSEAARVADINSQWAPIESSI